MREIQTGVVYAEHERALEERRGEGLLPFSLLLRLFCPLSFLRTCSLAFVWIFDSPMRSMIYLRLV
jgi:hypothetical protein